MNTQNSAYSLDDMIAKLNLMTTDFIFSKNPCHHRACTIAKILQHICQHKELAFFPEQQVVYCKMLQVWQALAHEVPKSEQSKQAEPALQQGITAMH